MIVVLEIVVLEIVVLEIVAMMELWCGLQLQWCKQSKAREAARCNSTLPNFKLYHHHNHHQLLLHKTLMNLGFSSICRGHKIVCNCTRFQNQVQQITIKWHPGSSGSYTGLKVLAEI